MKFYRSWSAGNAGLNLSWHINIFVFLFCHVKYILYDGMIIQLKRNPDWFTLPISKRAQTRKWTGKAKARLSPQHQWKARMHERNKPTLKLIINIWCKISNCIVNFTDTFRPGPVSNISRNIVYISTSVDRPPELQTTITWEPAWGKLFGRLLNRLLLQWPVIRGNIGAQRDCACHCFILLTSQVSKILHTNGQYERPVTQGCELLHAKC
jgi:hypothetical protein